MMKESWCRRCKSNQSHSISNSEVQEPYYPYRDSMDAEFYTVIMQIRKCHKCGVTCSIEKDRVYHESESDMQKYGYRGAKYGC